MGLDYYSPEQIEALPVRACANNRTSHSGHRSNSRNHPEPETRNFRCEVSAHASRSLHIEPTHHAVKIARRIRRARDYIAALEIV